MIVLDTNVLSVVFHPQPDPKVLSWLEKHALETAWITAMTEAEIRFGVARLPEGRRKGELAAAVLDIFDKEFADRILPFQSAATSHYAQIHVDRRTKGRPIHPQDLIIAAITRQHRATLATRNIRDFEDCGIELINPWDAE